MARRRLPPQSSPEWEHLAELYRSSPLDSLRKEVAKLPMTLESFRNAMNEAGIKRFYIPPVNPPEDKIAELLSRLVAIPKVEIQPLPQFKEVGDEETQVLLFSDSHTGQKTPEYDADVFRVEIKMLQKRVQKLCMIHRRACPVKKLAVFFLGDILENERVGFQLNLEELDKVVLDQIFEVSTPAIAEFLVNCLQVYEEIECHCVRGNHGSIGKFAASSSNWDTIIYKILELRLKEYGRIKWHIEDKSFYRVADAMGHKFLLIHGDQIPSYMNLPHYGIDRRVNRWKVNLPQDFEVVCMGHFHSSNFFRYSGVPVLVNGAFPLGSQYPLYKLGLADYPAQWTFFVSSERPITAMYEVQLSEQRPG